MSEVGHDPVISVKIVYLIRGRVLVVYLIKGKLQQQGDLSVFFDIDVKGGEKVWSGCYSWRSKQNSASFQGCHQCQRGGLLAYFTGRVCLSLMERTTTTMEIWI
jgi:hypothetical protein